MPSQRLTFFLIAATCAGLLAVALYMQEVMGLNPCYLCIVQRVFVIAVGALALLAGLHNPGIVGRRIYSGLGALAALAELRAPVERFFADVLVMAEDPGVRANRLGLLGALRKTFSAIADLSQLAARVGAQ